ncbi:hypothetical protein JTE90_005812 [Oedothorax gibbosus]|uniref:Uncharacterized protein n=1 Tax=Oedothorax gibbosus TaxID=931172 RepID=A0AAV6V3E5_9ARAC|nr:hypothetical protein JTE90_005812 [Oedothorax gibbosus]
MLVKLITQLNTNIKLTNVQTLTKTNTYRPPPTKRIAPRTAAKSVDGQIRRAKAKMLFHLHGLDSNPRSNPRHTCDQNTALWKSGTARCIGLNVLQLNVDDTRSCTLPCIFPIAF